MEKVAVSEFRANLVSFLKRVEKGEIIALTSRGHEIAKIIPPPEWTPRPIKGNEYLDLEDVMIPT